MSTRAAGIEDHSVEAAIVQPLISAAAKRCCREAVLSARGGRDVPARQSASRRGNGWDAIPRLAKRHQHQQASRVGRC
ncbi:hypothetical protein GCM10027053_46520 [Intrasporangium mesophilum]